MRLKFGRKHEEEPEIVRFLSKVPLFSGLSKNSLRTLIKDTREVTYPAGKIIIEEGEPSVVFHLILDGKVEIKRKNKTLARLGKGQFFGEMGLIEREPRTADVVAIEPTRCLAMTSWVWQGYLKTEPTVAFEVVKVLARRLRETDNALVE
jgi:CRP/FNR family transcriptional regulator, cyclic AMP receptor protein